MTSHDHPADAAPHAEGAPHALPPRVLLSTFAALVALTVVTVVTSRMDLGPMNVVVALGIAALKASLVAMFFMHLRYEHRFQTVIFLGAAFCAVVFIGFVVFDTTQYQPDLQAAVEALRRQAAAP
jgi:cytochrome c oxidase subunit 4